MTVVDVDLPARRLYLALAAVLALPAAVLGWQATADGPIADGDERAARAFGNLARDHEWLPDAADVLTWFGRFAVLGPLTVMAAVLLFARRRPTSAVMVLATTLGAQLLNIAIKEWIERARPSPDDPIFTAAGYSFPSGHAMVTTAYVGSVVLALLPFLARSWRPVAVAVGALLVLAMGATRLVLGVHYVSDVVAGHLLGASWVLLVVAALAGGTFLRRSRNAASGGAG